MRPRPGAALLAAVAVIGFQAGPSYAQDEVTVKKTTFGVSVPVVVGGAVSSEDAVSALNGVAKKLGKDRLHGCYAVDAAFEPGSGTAHQINVMAQRPGQFVETVADDSVNPYIDARTISAGARTLQDPARLRGLADFLLSPGEANLVPTPGELLKDAFDAADARTSKKLPACKWSGTLSLKTVYDPYHLTVSSSTTFSFTLDAEGKLKGTLAPATRSASVSESGVGSCSGSGFAMFKITMEGSASSGTINLIFHSHGHEADMKVSCSGGTNTFSGDYLRILFLPVIGVIVPVDERSGGSRTIDRNAGSGRHVTLVATVHTA